MPAPGTPEREQQDEQQARLVTGLLAAALQRPPSWSGVEPHNPMRGTFCSCCSGRRWWSRNRTGWCCMTCHPPPPRLPAQLGVHEVTT